MERTDPPAPIHGVSVLVVRDGAVLLVLRGRAPLKGYWALPGGRIEPGESPLAAATREVREETGLIVGGLRPIDDFDVSVPDAGGATVRYLLAVFAAGISDGTAAAGDDAAEVRWVAPALVDELRLTEQTRAIINRHVKAVADAS